MPTPRATPQHRPTLVVRAMRSSHELEEIQRFRYQVCAQEYGQAHLEGTNHRTQTIGDHLDRDFTVFGAFVDNALVGTLRWGLLSWTERPHRHTCHLRALGFDNPQQIGITDRLVLAPEMRRLSTIRELATTVATYALFAGSVHEFCWASPRITPLYMQLGYRDTGVQVTNDGGESLTILQLDLGEPDALKTIRSPLCGGWNIPDLSAHAA